MSLSLKRVFVIAAVALCLFAWGCDDDDDSSAANGNMTAMCEDSCDKQIDCQPGYEESLDAIGAGSCAEYCDPDDTLYYCEKSCETVGKPSDPGHQSMVDDCKADCAANTEAVCKERCERMDDPEEEVQPCLDSCTRLYSESCIEAGQELGRCMNDLSCDDYLKYSQFDFMPGDLEGNPCMERFVAVYTVCYDMP